MKSIIIIVLFCILIIPAFSQEEVPPQEQHYEDAIWKERDIYTDSEYEMLKAARQGKLERIRNGTPFFWIGAGGGALLLFWGAYAGFAVSITGDRETGTQMGTTGLLLGALTFATFTLISLSITASLSDAEKRWEEYKRNRGKDITYDGSGYSIAKDLQKSANIGRSDRRKRGFLSLIGCGVGVGAFVFGLFGAMGDALSLEDVGSVPTLLMLSGVAIVLGSGISVLGNLLGKSEEEKEWEAYQKYKRQSARTERESTELSFYVVPSPLGMTAGMRFLF